MRLRHCLHAEDEEPKSVITLDDDEARQHVANERGLMPGESAPPIGKDTRMPSTAVGLRNVEVLLRELAAADEFSGVVGVKRGDKELLLDAFGYASRTWNIPTTAETRFDTASITKHFGHCGRRRRGGG